MVCNSQVPLCNHVHNDRYTCNIIDILFLSSFAFFLIQPSRYSSRIEDIDFDEGKMLVHFDRWSHRYDEWIAWDSTRLRPLERPTLRKEGLKEEEGEITVGVFVQPQTTSQFVSPRFLASYFLDAFSTVLEEKVQAPSLQTGLSNGV